MIISFILEEMLNDLFNPQNISSVHVQTVTHTFSFLLKKYIKKYFPCKDSVETESSQYSSSLLC